MSYNLRVRRVWVIEGGCGGEYDGVGQSTDGQAEEDDDKENDQDDRDDSSDQGSIGFFLLIALEGRVSEEVTLKYDIIDFDHSFWFV